MVNDLVYLRDLINSKPEEPETDIKVNKKD
jgi:hypothetical protein